jgi:hypothetical protein
MTKVDWSNYNRETTSLHEAFSTCGLVLFKTETPGVFTVHRRGVFNKTLTQGYPHDLYQWLHETHGCPCDPYWLTK